MSRKEILGIGLSVFVFFLQYFAVWIVSGRIIDRHAVNRNKSLIFFVCFVLPVIITTVVYVSTLDTMVALMVYIASGVGSIVFYYRKYHTR